MEESIGLEPCTEGEDLREDKREAGKQVEQIE
jgi:hypothetical protein